MAAGHLRDLAAARSAVSQYDAMLEATKKDAHAFRAKYMEMEQDEARTWLAFLEGRNEDAVGLLGRVADKQDVEGKGEVALPAREMLGDKLLKIGRPEAALAEYEKSMKVDPNRFNGLYGAGRAAELAHERGKAAAYYEQLLKSCDGSNSARPELSQAKSSIVNELTTSTIDMRLLRSGETTTCRLFYEK